MTQKIAFFDIDGTLLDHQKKLPQQTIEAIQQLQDSGVYCAIATGRAPFMFEEIRQALGIESFVSFNGQYVVFEGKVVYENPLSTPHLAQMYQEAKINDHPMVFMSHEHMKASVSTSDHISESLSSLHIDYPEVEAAFFEQEKIYQALLFCEGDEIDSYRQTHHAFDFIRWHQFSVDVLPRGGSKAEGIDKMIEAAGMSTEQTYGFGDGLNDREMIEQVGTGIAMGNAMPEIKAIADHVTADVNEGGLVKAIYDIGLLK
ncbi:Cof-type HAD-IIB family hydrolase [Thalassobacillus sp. CUG 92003]|uniref:Cof-type HAD-IIB family hydrolase n=1 Tax=Thalassobacillus sp. CUG 92003 TaxID=2736641 RepID=UPI0015E6368A|nr:Cof-type HAD-IIB family hydrolase [Thalassobacillus sp. CUG 92003]